MSAAQKTQVVVIGAGVVGCAIAYQAALLGSGVDVIVLDECSQIAQGVTSRNSGVIHAGLYYEPGSLKAESCIRGQALMYEWCKNKGVAHKKTGKWVVGRAGAEAEADLYKLFNNAKLCGVEGLLEPGLLPENLGAFCSNSFRFGFFSPNTGIVDAHEATRSFQIHAEELGAQFIFNTKVHAISALASGNYSLETTRGPIESEVVINSAGLYADEVARMVGVSKYRIFPYRGDYFRLSARHKSEHLIYPVKRKNDPGLGVHLTLSLDGSLRLGPDVECVTSKESFLAPKNFEEKRARFFAAAQGFLPGIVESDLTYDTCGLRPKLRAPTDLEEKDFVISEDVPGFINVVGMESPGLTASLAIAQRVVKGL